MIGLKEYVNQNAGGSFYITRSQMPQIDDITAFEQHLRSLNVSYDLEKINTDKLIPTQTDYDVNKAYKNDSDKLIIVDEDGRILDGHHRFFHKQLFKIPTTDIMRVNIPLNQLISIAYDFNQ